MSLVLFAATVPGVPVPQGRPRVAKSGHAYYGKRSAAYRKALAWAFLAALRPKPTLAGPLRVIVEFAGARASADGDNLLKAVLDALQDAEVIASDNIRNVPEMIARVVPGPPCLRVRIERAEEDPGPAEIARPGAPGGQERWDTRPLVAGNEGLRWTPPPYAVLLDPRVVRLLRAASWRSGEMRAEALALLAEIDE